MTTPLTTVTETTETGQGFLPLFHRYALHTASLASLFVLRPPTLTNEDVQANIQLARDALTALLPEGTNPPPMTATTLKGLKTFLRSSRLNLTAIEAQYPGTAALTFDNPPTGELRSLFRHQWIFLSALDIELLDLPPNQTDAGKHA